MNVFELQPGRKQAGSGINRNVKVKAISSSTIKKKMSAMRSLLLLCLLKTGITQDLIAPSSHQAFLGADVSIPCSVTIKNPPIVPKSPEITWSFQGKEILNVRNSVAIHAEPRVSYRGKAEDGIADLIISNLTVTDGGIYKCFVSYNAVKREKEIRLDIQARPLINITDKVVVENKESVLHATISGFYPVDIEIKWFQDREILNHVTEKPQKNPDGTYSVNSSVQIIATREDRERLYSCRVKHKSLNQTLQENFQLVYGAVPSVHIISRIFKLNTEQALVCSASGFYPESIAVYWLLNGTQVKNTKTQKVNSSEARSIYEFLPTEKNWGMELACVVEHKTLSTPHVETLLVQGKDLTAKYKGLNVGIAIFFVLLLAALIIGQLYLKQRKKRLPKVRYITRSSGGIFSLDVDHLYLKDITISWEVVQPPSSAKTHPMSSTIIYHENPDGTYKATSTCESLRGAVEGNKPYIVQAEVTHKKLRRPEHREFASHDQSNTDFQSPPEVGMIQTPKMFSQKPVQLQCAISHFYPDHLTVNWFTIIHGVEAEIQTNNVKYKIIESRPTQQQDKTFSYTTCLELIPTLEDLGTEIICRVAHPSLEQPKERTTGPLQVLVKPEVTQPIQLSINDAGDMVASISLCNFYPEDFNLFWTYGNTPKSNSQEEIEKNADGTFTVHSHCTIPGDLFENPQFKVKVTWSHSSVKGPESREISTADPDFPWHPRITDITPLILQAKEENTITCTIVGYFSDKLRVTWSVKKKNGRTATETLASIVHTKMADNSYSCSPIYSFTPISVDEVMEIICSVEHPSLQQPITRSTGPPMVKVAPKMKKDGLKLTPRDPNTVLCSLSLETFYPESFNISWLFGKHSIISLPSTRKIIRTNDEKTFDAISECNVPWKYFGSTVRVIWIHESLPKPHSRELHPTDFPWHPVIEEMEAPVLRVNIKATLQYKISHYFPDDLRVSWYRREKYDRLLPLPTPSYTPDISNVQTQPDNTYSCIASLHFTPSLTQDEGSVIVCKVEHPSLEIPIERSTGPLQLCMAPQVIEPVRFSLCDSGEVRCSLTLKKFYPKPITITWKHDDKNMESQSTSTQSEDGFTFDATSVCRLPQTVKFPVNVIWRHQSMPQHLEIVLKKTDLPWHPYLETLNTSQLKLNTRSNINCKISGYFPAKMEVNWYKRKTGAGDFVSVDSNKYKMVISKHERQPDNTYSCTASLVFTPNLQEDDGSEFMCKVQHPILEKLIERKTGPLQLAVAPQVIEPVRFSLCDSGEVRCSLTLKKFYPKPITITWKHDDKNMESQSTSTQSEDGFTFDATSVCRLPQTVKFPVNVIWRHQSMPQHLEIVLKKTDLPWHPYLETLNTSQLKLNTRSNINCKISGYFPAKMEVNWYTRKTGAGYFVSVDSNKYNMVISKHERQPDNTYSCTASLVFTPNLQEDDGSEFMCKVQHPTLEKLIERKTGPLQLAGKLCATKELIEGLLPESCTHVNKPGTPRKLKNQCEKQMGVALVRSIPVDYNGCFCTQRTSGRSQA